jgi:hypothetical protein
MRMANITDQAELDRTRRLIAISMVITGVVLLAAVSGLAIGFAGADDRPEMARLVFASAVPLLGTWVGTVLAFYFARENLQAASESQRAATESTMSLVGRLAPTTPVSSVMIPVAQISPKEVVADDAAARALQLNTLYRAMRDTGNSRVPVFDANSVALYVIHEPDIDKYAQDERLSADALPDDHRLEQLLAKSELGDAVKAFTAVGPDADVAAARAKLQADPTLKDIFVTVGGGIEHKALGWITQSDLARVG